MNRLVIPAANLFVLFSLAGCAGSSPPQTPTASSTNNAEPAGGHDAGHEHGEASAGVTANLAKLSEVDRQAAEKQRMCPVSDEPLGSMGVPIKVDVNGQAAFICCEGCREDLLAEPDKFLAKLKR